MCAFLPLAPLLRNPTTGIANCWPRKARGHVTAAPPRRPMNSRRRISAPNSGAGIVSAQMSIPLCRENPKIGRVYDAEVVSDRIAEDRPVFRYLLAQEM